MLARKLVSKEQFSFFKQRLCLAYKIWTELVDNLDLEDFHTFYQLRLSAELGNPAPQAQPAP